MSHCLLGPHHGEGEGAEESGRGDETRKIVPALERFGEHGVRDHGEDGPRRQGGGGRPRFV